VDEATGLQYNHHRWYDNETGRWLPPDPIGFAGGDPNLYAYVGYGPTNGTDPSGCGRHRAFRPIQVVQSKA